MTLYGAVRDQPVACGGAPGGLRNVANIFLAFFSPLVLIYLFYFSLTLYLAPAFFFFFSFNYTFICIR